MFIANSRMIVGVMNSQAIALSESPRTVLLNAGGVAFATRIAMESEVDIANLYLGKPPGR